jgi:hypothetical protein
MSTYIEATINTALAPCDNSPQFTDQSMPYVCLGQPVYYNFGVTEPDGDSLAYRLIDARYNSGPVALPVPYNPGYSGAQPIPGITLYPITGQLVFTPTIMGNYVVVLEVEQFDANGNSIGTVMRDIMFVVAPCSGSPPIVQGDVDIHGPGGVSDPPPMGGPVTTTGPNSIEVCDG